MKIKLETACCMAGKTFDPGEVIDLPDEEARRYVKLGFGVAVETAMRASAPEQAAFTAKHKGR